MRLLVLGGTRFVGRHAVEAALAAGHTVTLFNRGSAAPGLFPGVESLRGDRAGDHAALGSGTWDAVLDVSGYRPAELRAAARRLKGRAGLYAFVSTVSVYARFADGGAEDAPAAAPAPEDAEQTPETYGPLKRACELALAEEWKGPSLVARAGLVAGPHDPTDRFTYWPVRLARGGRVLAPGAPDRVAQALDARDLGAWLCAAAAAGTTGVFNAVGPALRMDELLAACAAAARTAPALAWADDSFLTFRNVRPYHDLPLWAPAPVRAFDGAKAAAAGLKVRPARETAEDVLAWHRGRGEPALWAGLSAAQEKRLLAELDKAA